MSIVVVCISVGLSPRGRGKPVECRDGSTAIGSIPAWAGETRHAARPNSIDAVYPRVGGGNKPKRRRSRYRRGLSPRGRGKLFGYH